MNIKSGLIRYWLIISVPFMFFISSCSTEKKMVIVPWYPISNSLGDSVLAVYESRIPCSDCERLKFALVVYGNAQTGKPSTYTMSRIYVGKNNERLLNSGNIEIKQGTSLDPTHTVYHLSTGTPREYQSFWKVTEDILFILDDQLMPRVGNAGQGFVLNKISIRT